MDKENAVYNNISICNGSADEWKMRWNEFPSLNVKDLCMQDTGCKIFKILSESAD
jgi:hypothetical protein